MIEREKSAGHKGNPSYRLRRQMSKETTITGGTKSFWDFETLLLIWMKKKLFSG
jgi:hypothetical protein